MNTWTLIKKNLFHYRRTHLGVVLGTAVGTAVLTGALFMGDSVRHTLRSLALARLGETRIALDGHQRFFRSGLAEDLTGTLDADVAPVLALRGVLVGQGGEGNRSRVQVLGVDERFGRMGGAGDEFRLGEEEMAVNTALAAALGIVAGDEVLLRMEKPQPLPGEAPLSLDRDLSTTLRLKVKAVLSDEGIGRFSLKADQVPPRNAFIPLVHMGEVLELSGKANLLLVGGESGSEVTPEQADRALKRCFRLEDAGLSLRKLASSNQVELTSSRIFLEPEVRRAAVQTVPGGVGIFTYFILRISKGDKSTPYSFVTALGPLRTGDGIVPILPADLGRDEILINQWLAEDLGADLGDRLELAYPVMGPGRKFEEQKAQFHVRAVLPMEGAVLDQGFMPPYPGLAEGERCSDWNPGIDIDLSSIRDKDEDYWSAYRGTPKAFITLQAGETLWSNRFGSLTAVRYPLLGESWMQSIAQALREKLDPTTLGLFFRPVREEALKAGSQGQDFGPLFLGLSFFLVAAALILVGMLFGLSAEQRREELGILQALGFTGRSAGRLLLFEGILLAAAGALVGAVAGAGYTGAMIHFLKGLWRDAVASAPIRLQVEATTLLIGASSGLGIAVLTLWIALRRRAKWTVRALLDGTVGAGPLHQKRDRGKAGFIFAALSMLLAVFLIALHPGGLGEGGSGAGTFFGAGALLLLGGMGFIHGLLSRSATQEHGAFLTLRGLGLRNTARRRGRSLGVAAVLACGTFLVFSVGANRKNPLENAHLAGSGTGGFNYLCESALPLLEGLNTDRIPWADAVNVRVREGDDASCLNLNRAQHPRLLGVDPDALAAKEAFTFLRVLEGHSEEEGWSLLEQELSGGAIPAVADHSTIL
jgi:putative ABC transport system permease protein